MKKITILCLLISASMQVFGQEYKKPAEGKSLVYFVRFSGTGAVINFKYFDGETYLGKMNGTNYFTYECEPGAHTFWAASENRDYLTGELKANETYIIEVRPKMGGIKAAVRLHQVSPDNAKILSKVNKLLSKKEESKLKGLDEDLAFFIENGLERFEKIKDEAKVIEPDWTF